MKTLSLSDLYINPEPSVIENWFSHCKNRINKSLINNDIEGAILIAYDWADFICGKIGVRNEGNWKLFKKEIIKKYFGKYFSKKFKTGWDYNDVVDFLNNFQEKDFRVSVFPKNIACRSQSLPLKVVDKNSWGDILKEIDNSHDIEVFPQASNDNSICFRRFATLFGEEIKYEVGYGQAMNVFENEQGTHQILSCSLANNIFRFYSEDNNIGELNSRLKELIFTHNYYLQSISKLICTEIGLEWLSIEGYYQSDPLSKLLIVDIDLPFDYLFMLKSNVL